MSDLFVTRVGNGRPIVVVHGGLGLDQTYMRAFDRFADLAELIYVDVCGNGRSSSDGIATATLDTFADDLDALRAELGFEQWTVLGHSYGALIALTYAIKHPTRVAALIAVGGAPAFDHAPAVVANIGKRGQPEAAAALLAVLGQPARDDAHFAEVWPHVLPLYFHRWDPRHLAAFAETRWSAAGYNRGNELLATYDVRDELARISAPALVITGDDDFIMPASIGGAALAKGIRGARNAVVPNSGHFPFLESPIEFDVELRAWLSNR